jgi:hypothetical protein
LSKFFDILGNEMEVGDIVVVAATSGQTGELRIGRVVELISLTNKVRTEWLVGFHSYGNRNITIIGGTPEQVQHGTDVRNGYTIPLYRVTGNTTMSNFLCLHKARDYKPEV